MLSLLVINICDESFSVKIHVVSHRKAQHERKVNFICFYLLLSFVERKKLFRNGIRNWNILFLLHALRFFVRFMLLVRCVNVGNSIGLKCWACSGVKSFYERFGSMKIMLLSKKLYVQLIYAQMHADDIWIGGAFNLSTSICL